MMVYVMITEGRGIGLGKIGCGMPSQHLIDTLLDLPLNLSCAFVSPWCACHSTQTACQSGTNSLDTPCLHQVRAKRGQAGRRGVWPAHWPKRTHKAVKGCRGRHGRLPNPFAQPSFRFKPWLVSSSSGQRQPWSMTLIFQLKCVICKDVCICECMHVWYVRM
jgi:hypothetical protein